MRRDSSNRAAFFFWPSETEIGIERLPAHKQIAVELARAANGCEVEILQVLFTDRVDVFWFDPAHLVYPGLQPAPTTAQPFVLGHLGLLRVFGFELRVVIR